MNFTTTILRVAAACLIAFVFGCATGKIREPQPIETGADVNVEVGKTTIGEVINEHVIAYLDASAQILYVDNVNRNRVLTALRAEVNDDRVVVRQGKPFVGLGRVVEYEVLPFAKLPLGEYVGLNDARTHEEAECQPRQPGTCINRLTSVAPNVQVDFSFEAPSYGYSGCASVPNSTEECVSWLAEETVVKWSGPDCKETRTVEKISCYVCSLP